MTINFLLQAIKILTTNEYDENQLYTMVNFINAVDNDVLNDYNNTCTILSYNSDLELFTEVLDALIKVLEENEDYEICEILKNKKEDCIAIMETKTI